jgi:hypothetical protein
MKAKISSGLAAVLAAAVVAAGGCHKKVDQGPPPGHVRMWGVDLDTPRLDTDFTNASPEVQRSVRSVKQAVRRGQLPAAIAQLEQLAGDASLTAPQKKLASDLSDQLRQVLAKSHPAPAEQ